MGLELLVGESGFEGIFLSKRGIQPLGLESKGVKFNVH
jgi:hypothetical protein